MSTKRTIATLAVLGGLTAAVALATGAPAAKADEVSDLRANNQLLQQRLDQLAQVGTAKPQLPPGTASLAGSFPRSFLIPGTDTSIQIGGYIDLTGHWDLSGGSPTSVNAAVAVTGSPQVSGAPLDLHGTGLFAPPAFNPHSRGNGTFRIAANESRFFIETRTPTAWGEALTHLEADFYGCTASAVNCSNLDRGTNPQLLRLRLAYATLGGFLAGQNWVPVNDNAAHAELIDFGGEAGTFGFSRAPQFGYKWSLPYGISASAYAVQPQTSFVTPVGALEDDCSGTGLATTYCAPTALAVNPGKTTMPDGNFILEFQQPWGHLRFAGVVQKLELEDGAFISKEYIGYGGGFSGNVHPDWFGWSKDNLGFEFFAGDGLGHYATSPGSTVTTGTIALATNYGGPAVNGYGTGAAGSTTAANAALVRATTLTQWGGQVNYQHWWMPNLRSTASFGVLHQDVPTSLVTMNAATFSYNKEWVTAHANLIWSPIAFIDTGVEYTYGHRVTVFNAKGDINVIEANFRVKF